MIRSATDRKVEARRVALASAIGTTIEWYDFFIYGTAAAVVFAPQFFPQVSALAGTLASFATRLRQTQRNHFFATPFPTTGFQRGCGFVCYLGVQPWKPWVVGSSPT